MSISQQPAPQTTRQPVNPARMRTSGIIFIVVSLSLAVGFTVLSLMTGNWRFLAFAATPIVVQLAMGIVYVSNGARAGRRTPA